MESWILCGVAGSGKSTLAGLLAQKTGRLLLDADDFHPEANLKKMAGGKALDESDREAWLQGISAALSEKRAQGLVLAVPGLKAMHRSRLAAAAGKHRFIYLKCSPETARKRLESRGGFFPPALVESQFEALEEPTDALCLDAELGPEILLSKIMEPLDKGALGMVGMGRMGLGMARRLLRSGFSVSGFDSDEGALADAARSGVKIQASLKALLQSLPSPRRLLISLPAGATQACLGELQGLLGQGDLLIDAANGFWKESRARGEKLRALGVHFLDAGVSGGVRGEAAGYCVMAGGSEKSFSLALPILEALAAENGVLHCGPSGSGHFVKMAHNGAEYALMQSLAEGFELLKAYPDAGLPLGRIADLWNHGAVLRSWLLELAAETLAEDPGLSRFKGQVGELGTGRWAAEAAQELGLNAPALNAALAARAASKTDPNFGTKLLSALREKFGGHREA